MAVTKQSAAPGVWQIRFPWTNAWALSRDGEAVIVDTGTRWDRRALSAALDEINPRGFRLNSVLLTHAHCDHAGNAAYLSDRFGASIHCHFLEEPFLASHRTYIPRGIRALSLSGVLFATGELVFPVSRRAPDAVLGGKECIETPIGPLRVIETPGHTEGHISYFHEEEGWLFSGDALLNIIPWLRRPGLSLPIKVFSQDISRCVESARKLAALGPAALFPGHGPPIVESTAARIRAFLDESACE